MVETSFLVGFIIYAVIGGGVMSHFHRIYNEDCNSVGPPGFEFAGIFWTIVLPFYIGWVICNRISFQINLKRE